MTEAFNPQSTVATAAASPDTAFALISNEKLLAIYEALLKCRMLQQYARNLFQQGKLESDLHASTGREASAAAVVIELLLADTLCISAGDWLPAFVRNASPEYIFRLLASPSRRENQPDSRRMEAENDNLLVAWDALEQPELVAGRISRDRTRKRTEALAVFFPPHNGPLDHWKDFIGRAAEKKYPVLLIDHVSQDAAATRGAQRTSKNPQALFNGIPVITVDAADPIALSRVAHEAVVRARQRRGATLIQCLHAERIGAAQTEPDPAATLPGDPVSTLEKFLRTKAIEPEHHRHRIVSDFNRELELASRFIDRS